MPSPVAHLMFGTVVALSITKKGDRPSPKNIVLGSFAAGLADLDLLLVLLGFEWTEVHRTFSHSFPFAIALTGLCFLWDRNTRFSVPFLLIGFCLFSHLMLDLLSPDTRFPYGLMLLWPFSNTFYYPGIELFMGLATSDGTPLPFFTLATSIVWEVVLVGSFGIFLRVMVNLRSKIYATLD